MSEQQFLKFSSDAFLWCFSKKDDRKIELDMINPLLYIYVSVLNKDKIYNVFLGF